MSREFKTVALSRREGLQPRRLAGSAHGVGGAGAGKQKAVGVRWERARTLRAQDAGPPSLPGAGLLHCRDRGTGKRSLAPALACLPRVGEEPQPVEIPEGRFLWLASGRRGGDHHLPSRSPGGHGAV